MSWAQGGKVKATRPTGDTLDADDVTAAGEGVDRLEVVLRLPAGEAARRG